MIWTLPGHLPDISLTPPVRPPAYFSQSSAFSYLLNLPLVCARILPLASVRASAPCPPNSSRKCSDISKMHMRRSSCRSSPPALPFRSRAAAFLPRFSDSSSVSRSMTFISSPRGRPPFPLGHPVERRRADRRLRVLQPLAQLPQPASPGFLPGPSAAPAYPSVSPSQTPLLLPPACPAHLSVSALHASARPSGSSHIPQPSHSSL